MARKTTLYIDDDLLQRAVADNEEGERARRLEDCYLRALRRLNRDREVIEFLDRVATYHSLAPQLELHASQARLALLQQEPNWNYSAIAAQFKEMQKVAQLYHAELHHKPFYTAHLPLESFPKRHEIAATWLSQGDPAGVIARVIREFRPDLLLTLAPEFGYTGHIEHQLASSFAMLGIRLAADPAFSPGLSPHRISHTYFLVNKNWFMKLWGRGYDPRSWTDIFDVRIPCSGNRPGTDIMRENIEIHRSQPWDMAMFYRLSNIIHHLFLYRADPYQEIQNPFEPQEHSKFGLHRIKFNKGIDVAS